MVLVISAFMVITIIPEGQTSGKRISAGHSGKKYFSHSKRPNARLHYNQRSNRHQHVGNRYRKTERNILQRSLFPALNFIEPKVIKNDDELVRNGLRITTTSGQDYPPQLDRHVFNEGPGGSRVIYYSKSLCEGGYDCIIRLGGSRSSPKIITVGKKRKVESSGPKIIYPPS